MREPSTRPHRRRFDSVNLSDTSSFYGSNKSVVIAHSRLAINGGDDSDSARVFGGVLARAPAGVAGAGPVHRHRVVSLSEDSGGGSGLDAAGFGRAATSTRLLRLVSPTRSLLVDEEGNLGSDAEFDAAEATDGAESASAVPMAASASTSSTSRPRTPPLRRNLEMIPESKLERDKKSQESASASLARKEVAAEAVDDSRNENYKKDDEESKVLFDKNENNARISLAEGAKAGTVLPTTTPTTMTTSEATEQKPAILRDVRGTGVERATSASGVNIGFRPLDEFDMKALQLSGAPKK